MTDEQLKQGIYILHDMEINNYLMTRAINGLNNKIASLGHARKYSAPTKKRASVDTFDNITTAGYIGAFAGAIIFTLIIWFSDGGFFLKLLSTVVSVVLGAVGGAIAGAVIALIWSLVLLYKKNKNLQEEYTRSCVVYDTNVREDQERVNNEIIQKKALEKQRMSLQFKLADSKQLLKKFYNQMNIDNRFRHIIPMGYMYEFSRLNVSNHLEGVDGLYYLVHKELRWDVMQYTLNDISEKLDTIIDQNRELYREIRQINSKCDSMVNSTAEMMKSIYNIDKNTNVTAYNTERTQRETEFQSYMMIFDRI